MLAGAGEDGSRPRQGPESRGLDRRAARIPSTNKKQHGFIDSQKMGMEVFRKLDPNAPLIVAESVWQYSHHVLAGLTTHRGPILTVANWSGTWPGLVGMLNLNGSLTKAGVRYSTLWSEDFKDDFFRNGLRQWLQEGVVTHDQSHVKDLRLLKLPLADEQFGKLRRPPVPPAEGHHGRVR